MSVYFYICTRAIRLTSCFNSYSGVTFQSVLDKLTQFTKLCHTTGHDVADENGIWVSTRITAKERGEDGKETSRPWILCATVSLF